MADTVGRSLPARVLLKAIAVYQVATASPIPSCRYLPTCSAYAAEAVALHGASRGSWLAAKRVSRCHPFGGHGYDPVPGATPVRSAEKGCVDV